MNLSSTTSSNFEAGVEITSLKISSCSSFLISVGVVFSDQVNEDVQSILNSAWLVVTTHQMPVIHTHLTPESLKGPEKKWIFSVVDKKLASSCYIWLYVGFPSWP